MLDDSTAIAEWTTYIIIRWGIIDLAILVGSLRVQNSFLFLNSYYLIVFEF
jgi:hypothetical protein